jgi:hypothetical protein
MTDTVSINTPNQVGETPVLCAARLGQLSTIKFLHQNTSADFHAFDKVGCHEV